MNPELDKEQSIYDLFIQTQETLDDAKKKNQQESQQRSKYIRLSKDGTYNFRILPLAPTVNSDGEVQLPRKGYEYPTKEFMLSFVSVSKGKEKKRYQSVCNAKLAFPDLPNDLIELYVNTACEKHADDEALVKKLRGSSFEGGLKYTNRRCMYVIDCDNRSEGLQILQISYSQYRELEERKLATWAKLYKARGTTPCPISSIKGAFPVEIVRKTEGKTSYSFNIDTLAGEIELTEAELQALYDAPRLPEVLYEYRRRHLEATILFLKQTDEKYGIDIMSEQDIKDCIEQIRLKLPSDDTSHFSLDSDDKADQGAADITLDDLWALYDNIEAEGLGDRSDEGQSLRSQLREFIETNNLDIRVDRKKTNIQVLEEIEALMSTDNSSEKPKPVVEEDEEDDAPAATPSFDDDDDDDEDPYRRNDDTNEPAVRRRPRTARR